MIRHPSADQLINVMPPPAKITETIDINTLKERLEQGHYSTTTQFIEDARRIWKDALNDESNEAAHSRAKIISEFFESLMADILKHTGESIVEKPNTMIDIVPSSTVEKQVSEHNKSLLKNRLTHLSYDNLQGVVNIVKSVSKITKDQEFEFDIDKLPIEVYRELERYVNSCNVVLPEGQPSLEPSV